MRAEGFKWIVIIIGLVFIYRFINKDSLMYVINRDLPPQEAGIMSGMLLGDKGGFDKDFYQYLKNSGLIHLVIVSGSNVILLVGGLIETLAGYFGRKKIIVGGMFLGWGYATMVGWEVPVVRAMLLLMIMYWAQLLGRKYDVVRGLALAVTIMIIGEAGMLTSVSFWLTMMAFIGVMTAKEVAVSVVAHAQCSKILLETTRAIKETVWVSLWITPILGMVFGRISIVSPVTNLLVMGVVEVITLTGAVAAVVGLVIPAAGKLILWLTYPLLKYFAAIVELGGKGVWSTVGFKFNWWMLAGWYLIMVYLLVKKKAAAAGANHQ